MADHASPSPLTPADIPCVSAPIWPDVAPTRFAASIATASSTGCDIALLGLPDDTGVKRNRGRPGAREGPHAFRAALAKLGARGPALPEGTALPRVFDAGDVIPAGDDIDLTHDRVTKATTALLQAGLLPVAIGGGHDLTFPFVRALTLQHETLVGVSFDPHLDVREQTGSGMPFRKLLELPAVREHHIFGFDPLVNTLEHASWFTTHGGCIHNSTQHGFDPQDLDRTLKATDGQPHPRYVSFDMDVLDASCAPGVSAMNPAGWPSSTGILAAHMAGRSPLVRCFDIMELSPPNDQQGRTARLAAALFLAFLQGFSERPRCPS